MEKKENVLIDALPSPVAFAAVMTVLYLVACLLTFLARGHIEVLAAKGLVSVPCFMMFATIYGAMVGFVVGIAQKKALSVPVGVIAGMVGGWFNWGFLLSITLWGTIYVVWLMLKSIFTWHGPLWTLFSDMDILAKAFTLSYVSYLVWAVGLVLGIVLLFLYSRSKYAGDVPAVDKKVVLAVLLVMTVTGLVAAISAPVASLDDLFATTESRAVPDDIGDLNANFGYVVPDHGEWTISIDGPRVSVREGLNSPDVTLTLSRDDMIRVGLKSLILERQIDRFRAEGDLALATKNELSDFFEVWEPPAKKKKEEGGGGMFAKDTTIENIFTTMPKRAISKAIAGVNGRFGFKIKVFMGGDWTVIIENGKVRVEEGLNDPAVTISMSKEDFVGFAEGRVNLAERLTRFKVEGDRQLLTNTDTSRYFEKYQPTMNGLFKVLMIFFSIILVATFSVAPLICLYDTTLSWRFNK